MTYPVWSGQEWVDVPVPVSGNERIVVPNVAAIVFSDESRSELLLQRRDKDGEPVQGMLEIPAGRWAAGEDPWQALRREVADETGLQVERIDGELRRYEAQSGRPFVATHPACVAVGVDGAYPALVIGFACVASGTPRPQPGETADPRWYPVAEVLDLPPEGFTGPTLAILTEYFRPQSGGSSGVGRT